MLPDLFELYTVNKQKLSLYPELESLSIKQALKLWKHNCHLYLLDSYTLSEENIKKNNLRLLSTDVPVYFPIFKNIRVLLTSQMFCTALLYLVWVLN